LACLTSSGTLAGFETKLAEFSRVKSATAAAT